jgi:DNA-binding transcriptional regulator GbsR (MarR family)
VYKKQMHLRLKQARTLMIPEWEKDERVIDKLKAVLAKIREEINRNKNETFVKEVKTFVETVEVKIDRYYKTKEYDNMLK